MIKNGFWQNPNGDKYWLKNNYTHRIGSASQILYKGARVWTNDACRHRLDGPAIIQRNNVNEWYICDININDQLYHYCHANNINILDYRNLKFADKLKLKFKFGLVL